MQVCSLKLIVELSHVIQTGLIDSLQQQIMNRLVHAIEAMQRDGDIAISTDFCPKQDASSIETRNTGPRILPYNRDKIFTSYFSTKKHETGLGFSLRQHIIVAHHYPIVLVTAEAILGASLRMEFSCKQPQALCVPQTQ